MRLLVSGTTWGRTGASRGGRGRGHRGESRGQGMARAGGPAGDRRGLEPPGLAGCLFWWFGGREEEGAAVVVDINPSGGVRFGLFWTLEVFRVVSRRGQGSDWNRIENPMAERRVDRMRGGSRLLAGERVSRHFLKKFGAKRSTPTFPTSPCTWRFNRRISASKNSANALGS